MLPAAHYGQERVLPEALKPAILECSLQSDSLRLRVLLAGRCPGPRLSWEPPGSAPRRADWTSASLSAALRDPRAHDATFLPRRVRTPSPCSGRSHVQTREQSQPQRTPGQRDGRTHGASPYAAPTLCVNTALVTGTHLQRKRPTRADGPTNRGCTPSQRCGERRRAQDSASAHRAARPLVPRRGPARGHMAHTRGGPAPHARAQRPQPFHTGGRALRPWVLPPPWSQPSPWEVDSGRDAALWPPAAWDLGRVLGLSVPPLSDGVMGLPTSRFWEAPWGDGC